MELWRHTDADQSHGDPIAPSRILQFVEAKAVAEQKFFDEFMRIGEA